jgi:hypothetical protein
MQARWAQCVCSSTAVSYLLCAGFIGADMSVLEFPGYSFWQVFPLKAHAVIVGGGSASESG